MTVSSWVRLQVFWRSLFIQAGFNPTGMQSLGLTYALLPALKQLYPDPEAQHDAVRRHLSTTFNTHPYVAAAIVGGILWHEERISRGEEPAESVDQFKSSLQGPLAALGDGFFWLSLRPAVGAVCAALVPILSAWSAVLFLVLYNAVHFTARARFFRHGYSQGPELVTWLAAANIPRWGERLRTLAAAAAGGLVAWLAVAFGAQQGGLGAPLLAGGCLLAAAASWAISARAWSPFVMLYSAAALAGAAGALL